MGYSAIFFDTQLPESLISEACNFIDNQKIKKETASVISSEGKSLSDPESRQCNIGWIEDECWIGGFLWHYIGKANRLNFKYDISHIDSASIQLTEYSKNDFFEWHVDDCITSRDGWDESVKSSNSKTVPEEREWVRKLSFSLLLSNPENFTGGELELLAPTKNVFSPKPARGRLIIFDSTTLHRIRPIKSGLRKSLVGWVVGPRWR